MTAERFLELLPRLGIDIYRRADGRLAITGPDAMLDAIQPQVACIGRDAIEAAFSALEREAKARVKRSHHGGAA